MRSTLPIGWCCADEDGAGAGAVGGVTVVSASVPLVFANGDGRWSISMPIGIEGGK